ncbi:MAG: hypothetical protein AB1715_14090 [Acidobacteriota bacterium]
MIRDAEAFSKWEKEWVRREPPDFFKNVRIYEAMYEEACLLGVLPSKNPLEGIDEKIKLAKALNISGTSRKARPGS